ncbi:unnamed protein product, partial [marine sediment metagenome]
MVIDEDTVIVGGRGATEEGGASAGWVYKTTRHGARPWANYEIDTTYTIM